MTASVEFWTNGFYFDLAVLAPTCVGVWALVRWLGRGETTEPEEGEHRIEEGWATSSFHPGQQLWRLRCSCGWQQHFYDNTGREAGYISHARRKHLADRAVGVPISTHEGDWDWPRRQEHNRLLRS